jgi:D-alanyl-D-alanine carboxypeptidase
MAGRARRLVQPARLRNSLGIPSDYGARRGLKPQREAIRLVSAGRDTDGRPLRLAPRAAAAWKRMRSAAARDGIVLLGVSGHRGAGRQAEIIRAKLASGQKIGEILRWVAAPGYSQHHTGRAIDIGSPGETDLAGSFARTPEFRWLRRRAGAFGFRMSYPPGNRHGIAYEPWHRHLS